MKEFTRVVLIIIIFCAANTVSWAQYTIGTPNSATGTITNDDFPTVVSIVRKVGSTNPTNANNLTFTVTFNTSVSGLDAGDFILTKTGTVDGMIGTPTTSNDTIYEVSITNIIGDGTLRLDVDDDNTIVSTVNNTAQLGGATEGDGDFNTGETFTIQTTTLTLVSSNPMDNATNVTLSQNIVLTFSRNVFVGTGNILIKQTDDDMIFETIAVGSASVNNAEVTINPTNNFKKGTGYYLEIAATAFDDEVGNSYAGINDKTTLNFSTVDVVINEVVTDPQQDWGGNDFNGTLGSGTISDGTDEWLELFVKSANVDFTGWTIELLYGSDIMGDLTNSGAFQTSNYISTGGGTFTNSVTGDFLVLGNPMGSGAMNNSITINLKDPAGVIVDAVVLGGSGNAPDGNATGNNDESVQRIPNGSDTDNDAADFLKTATSMGALNKLTPPAITSQPNPDTTCQNGAASFSVAATASNGGNLEYLWQESVDNGVNFNNLSNGAIYNGIVTTTLNLTGVTASMDSSQYRVIITEKIGTFEVKDTTNAERLIVLKAPTIINPNPDTTCVNGDVSFSATVMASEGGALTYQW
ncbi:MAG: Ig-like domain-containing protein [Bacteroidota bacterium]